MNFEVGDAGALKTGDRLERTNLVCDELLDVIGALYGQHSATEPPQVHEAWVGANIDFFAHRMGYSFTHGKGVAGMEAAGDVRRGNDLEQGRVVAHCIGAVAFSHVGIQIDELQGRSY